MFALRVGSLSLNLRIVRSKEKYFTTQLSGTSTITNLTFVRMFTYLQLGQVLKPES